MSLARKALLVLAGLLVILPVLGLVYQGLGEAGDRRRFPMPGQRFDVGGYALHIHCIGEGRPTVLFEAGTGGTSADWAGILESVGRETRACAYDRAGFGWSDPAPHPRDPSTLLKELHTLLGAAGETGSIVFAGHSFGGWMARLYAAEHPERVVGIVLVDSAHEDQWDRIPEAYELLESALGQMGIARAMARFGLVRLLSGRPLNGGDAARLRPDFYREFPREAGAIDRFVTAVRASGASLDLPLAVVSAGRSFDAFPQLAETLPLAEANRRWAELQADLVTLSSNARQWVSPESTHAITQDDPAIVIEAVLRVVEQVRSGVGG